MAGKNALGLKKTDWRGYTLQLFLITILPLSVLLLIVAFGSQSLHHEAMRTLVGDRDLRTANIAAKSIEQQLGHLSDLISFYASTLPSGTPLPVESLRSEFLQAGFDKGFAFFTSDGRQLDPAGSQFDWLGETTEIDLLIKTADAHPGEPRFSGLISINDDPQNQVILLVQKTLNDEYLICAFSPVLLLKKVVGELAQNEQIAILIVSPKDDAQNFDIIYQGGSLEFDQSHSVHLGIPEALAGENGITYFHSNAGEHVVAYSPIRPLGWGLIIEEGWEDITNPYLNTTQAAPLVVVPLFLLSLLAIWFGTRWIVTPLQKLEHQASLLATGDFDAIRQPVGGIEEIHHLQIELVNMADELKAAQSNLRSYIGAITDGVENERRNLARELHDDTIQSMIALNQRIQLLLMNSSENTKNSILELQTLIQSTMINLRRIIRGLRPIYLEELGLIASIKMLVVEVQLKASFPIQLTIMGQELRLNPQTEMTLYRIIQEALNNVIKHAEATNAWIQMTFSDKDLLVELQDDGRGFLVPGNMEHELGTGHYGLIGIQERSELIKAELKILSTPGEGTKITIRIHLDKDH